MSKKKVIRKGAKFGQLTVVDRSESPFPRLATGEDWYRCQCACDRLLTITGSGLLLGWVSACKTCTARLEREAKEDARARQMGAVLDALRAGRPEAQVADSLGLAEGLVHAYASEFRLTGLLPPVRPAPGKQEAAPARADAHMLREERKRAIPALLHQELTHADAAGRLGVTSGQLSALLQELRAAGVIPTTAAFARSRPGKNSGGAE